VQEPALLARIAREEGRFDESVKLLRRSLAALKPLDSAGPLLEHMHELARSQLDAGLARAALATTRRAVALHRKLGLGALQGLDVETLWWRHSLALAANGLDDDAWEPLERAYGFICQTVSSLGDEGLRRNALNKPRERRNVVAAWLREARRRRVPTERRLAHLAGETHFRAPFERLVDTGLRLNELRSAGELHEFLIEEATELTGGERVLLVLDTPRGRTLAGSTVPRGEEAQATLARIGPLLDEARRKRAVILRQDARRASEFGRRSRIVAPLVVRGEVAGWLYADVDEAFGPFHDGDRDLLGMLAAQAAVALDNARWAEGLEREVAQRTGELQASNGQLAQRAAELAVINSIQQGIAAELELQASSTWSATSCARCSPPETSASGGGMPSAGRGTRATCSSMACASITRPTPSSLARSGSACSTGARRCSSTTAPNRWRWACTRWRARTRACRRCACRSSAATGCSAASCWRTTKGRTRSARMRCACSAPWWRAWASRWRTRACSTKRSVC
jgi:hypothetical protein